MSQYFETPSLSKRIRKIIEKAQKAFPQAFLKTPPTKCLKGKFQKTNRKTKTKNAYSPNALTTSNRIPAKADLQSPSHATLRLGAPLLFPAHLRRSRGFESLPAVFRELVEDV